MNPDPPIPQELWSKTPAEVQAAITALVQSFERRIAELESRLKRNSTNSSNPPSSDPPSVKRRPPVPPSGKRRGGQLGHARHIRPLVPPEQLRQVIDLKPPACRCCGHRLRGEDPEPRRHQVAELPPVRPVVDEYRLHRLACPRCGTTTRAQRPRGVPAGGFGPRLRAALGLLAGAYRLGKRLIRQLAHDLLGLSISTGMIAKLERRSAAELEAPVEEVRRHIRRAAAVHIDETSWRQCRRKAWLWVARTCTATAYTIAGSRGAGVARQVLGDTAGRVIISDRFPSYGWIGTRQLCWAHLRRDFQAMIDRGGEAAEVGHRLLERSDRLFHWWHRVRDGTMAWSTLKGYVDPLRWGFRRELERGAACGCPKTAATCRELLEAEPHLWRFVGAEGVEPTNNAAERALRHPVLWRKCSGGTDSEAGSRFVERMLSVVMTCRQQGTNALEFLARCYRAALEGTRYPSLLPEATTANGTT